MKTWVVPGSPLTDGSGWTIWYAHPGTAAYEPAPVEVRRGPDRLEVSQSSRSLGTPGSLGRHVTIATVRLSQPQPGRTFTVHIPELDGPRTWQTLPSAVTEDGVRFVFASCFWQNDDAEGYYYRAVDAILRAESPRPVSFKCLAGDQVYLDYPIPVNPAQSYESKVAERYRQYWGDANYQQVLATTPNFFLCDDHEWWNDYPERQAQLPFTYTQGQRDRFGHVATEYYESFQRALNPGGDSWYSFDIDPVSFFFADTRSARDPFNRSDRPARFMQADQWAALTAWQASLRGPGLLVTGMPPFQRDGNWKDHSLSNFPQDNRDLLELFTRSLSGQNDEGRPHDIVILSGDIHTGRYCIGQLVGHPGWHVHELIASPASRIGPMVAEPAPTLPPGRLPEKGAYRWADLKTVYATVENNIGVVRLFPASRHPYRIRLEFASYLVRPYRRPTWKIWASEPPVDFADAGSLKLYENRSIYLR